MRRLLCWPEQMCRRSGESSRRERRVHQDRPLDRPQDRRWLASSSAGEIRKAGQNRRANSFCTGLLVGVCRAERKGRPGARYPGWRINALSQRLPIPIEAQWRQESHLQRNSTSRLQWRHRVGFAPTSHGRRALGQFSIVQASSVVPDSITPVKLRSCGAMGGP